MISPINRWNCTECGQGFTRKSSGKRHVSNLHLGNASIVRFVDYITGRVKGYFCPPSDPITYRRGNRHPFNSNQKNNRPMDYYKNNPRVLIDNFSHFTDAASTAVQPSFWQPAQSNTHDSYSNKDPMEIILKINKMKMLLRKYCSHQESEGILGYNLYLLNQGLEHDFEKNLRNLCKRFGERFEDY